MPQLSDFLSACLEIDNPDGSVTWQSVDLETFQNEGKFQIFNTYIGSHEFFENLEEAKQRWVELKAEITATFFSTSQQQQPEEIPENLFRDTPLPINDDTSSSNVAPEIKTF